MVYKEDQYSWTASTILVFVTAFMGASYFNEWGSNPLPLWLFLSLSILFLFIILLFFRMRTIVNQNSLLISFGIGLIKRTINIKDISDCKLAINHWDYGFGIRVLNGGVLYNIQSLKGIDLNFVKHKSFVRIGSKRPEELVIAIKAVINK